MAERLLGVYRTKDFIDPKIFAVALAGLFQTYSVEAGLLVSDPVSGYASKHKWAPSLAEVKTELDWYTDTWALGLRSALTKDYAA